MQNALVKILHTQTDYPFRDAVSMSGLPGDLNLRFEQTRIASLMPT